MTKPYLLFIYNTFYPLGGWNDFVASFDSIEDAISYLKEDKEIFDKEAHILFKDEVTCKIVLNARKICSSSYQDSGWVIE